MQQRSLRCAVLVVVIWGVSAPVWSQGPETYAMPHLFALPSASTTRLAGMGSITACTQDQAFPNPAFAGAVDAMRSGVRYSLTDFDTGLTLKGTQFWANAPLGDGGEGVQLIGYHLDSDRGMVTTPGGPLALSVHENDLGFHYGRRFGEYWLLGIGLSPVLHTTTNYYNPLDGTVLAHLDSSAAYGARFGALYQFMPDGFAGLIYDYYKDDVNLSSVALPTPFAGKFTATTLSLGVSGPVNERTLAAVEWDDLRSERGSLKTKTSGLRMGLEYAATENLKVRAGLSDGSPSGGLGYETETWKADYAYLSDWNDDAVGSLLGGSDTHQLEFAWTW